MTKDQIRECLLVLFAASHVNAWLARFEDSKRWETKQAAVGEFVGYINSLPQFE